MYLWSNNDTWRSVNVFCRLKIFYKGYMVFSFLMTWIRSSASGRPDPHWMSFRKTLGSSVLARPWKKRLQPPEDLPHIGLHFFRHLNYLRYIHNIIFNGWSYYKVFIFLQKILLHIGRHWWEFSKKFWFLSNEIRPWVTLQFWHRMSILRIGRHF